MNELLINGATPAVTSAMEYATIVDAALSRIRPALDGVAVVFKNRPQGGPRTVERRDNGTLVFRIDTSRASDEVADDVAAAVEYACGMVGSSV